VRIGKGGPVRAWKGEGTWRGLNPTEERSTEEIVGLLFLGALSGSHSRAMTGEAGISDTGVGQSKQSNRRVKGKTKRADHWGEHSAIAGKK